MDNSNNNFSWNYLCSDADKIIKELNILMDRSKAARNEIIKLNTNTKENCMKILGILADDTFEFNTFHSLSKLLRWVAPTKKIRDVWKSVDESLVKYNDKLNSDMTLFKHLITISNEHLDNVDRMFFDKVIKCFSKHGLVINNKGNYEEKVKLCTQINALENKIVVDVEHGKFSQSDLYDLVCLRNKYSKLVDRNECNSYATLKSNIDVTNLQCTLKSLLANSHQTCFDELKMACMQMKQDKVSINDIVKYKYNLFDSIKIPLKTAILFVFKIIGEKFNIEFSELDDVSAWHAGVRLFAVKYHNQSKPKPCGYIYVDLLERQGKCHSAVSIILNNAVIYPYNSGTLRIPVTALIGNFQQKVTYCDIVNIFREMSSIVHTIFHQSKYEIMVEPNMKSIMEYLFEYIGQDIDTIKKLQTLNIGDAEYIHSIITADKAFKLKYKCTNTLFDYMLHGPNNDSREIDLTQKYNTIFKGILNKSKEQFILPSQLPNDVVIQLVYDGGLLYTDVTNNIVSFNIYTLLKERNLFHEFVDSVLKVYSIPFSTLITSFINSNSKSKSSSKSKSKDIGTGTKKIRKVDISDNTNYFTEEN
jgi:hypothetical protein